MAWIRVEDTIFDHPAFIDDGERIAWLWMIKRAAWKAHRVRYRNRIISLERGQFAMTVRDLAKSRGWKKTKSERFLKRLKTETMIETDCGTGVNVVTICNYNKYQSADNSDRTVDEVGTGTVPGQYRDSAGTEREQDNINTQDIRSVCVCAREAVSGDNSDPDVSRETSELCQAWEDFKSGEGTIIPGEHIALAASIKRNGLPNLLGVIAKARGSPFLRGETGNWGGMPLRWLCDDLRIAEVLRGEHDRTAKNDNGAASRYVGFLRRGAVSEEDAGGSGREPDGGQKLIDGRC